MKLLIPVVIFAALGGCASFDGRMVNVNGDQIDCSSSGGGFGLGAVVGVAAAAASNSVCESDAEEKGYVHADHIGESGMDIVESNNLVSVRYSKEPASPCVQIGDILKEVDSQQVNSLKDAKTALFKEEGTQVTLALMREQIPVECNIELTETIAHN